LIRIKPYLVPLTLQKPPETFRRNGEGYRIDVGVEVHDLFVQDFPVYVDPHMIFLVVDNT